MQKGRGLALFAFVLVGIMLIMPFASAGWFSDLFKGKVTGNVVYDSGDYSGLEGYYNFESDFNDRDGGSNTYNAVPAGGVSLVSVDGNNAGRFSGSSQYLNISKVNIGTNPEKASISMWIKPDEIPSSVKRFYSRTSEPGVVWSIFLGLQPTGKVNYGVSSGTDVYTDSTTSLSAGNWYHITLV